MEPPAWGTGNDPIMSFDVFGGLSVLGGGFLGYIVPFLVVLTIVVFFHELGHFLVARWNGVKIVTFSIGFGPELLGFNDRHGTRWKLSAIPLGGYVKFFGDENAASVPDPALLAKMTPAERKESFVYQRVGPRAAIVAAGPIANFLLAIVIFTSLYWIYGMPPAQSARVDEIKAGSAAAAAGFQVGDVVLSIDGKPIKTFVDMQRIVSASAGQVLEVVVERNGRTATLKPVPVLEENKDPFGNISKRGILGITSTPGVDERKMQPVSFPGAVGLALKQIWAVFDGTFSYIHDIFTGRAAADQLGGPIMIAQASGHMAKLGVAAVLHFVGVLSVSIGLLNLFPVPLLDGGHLLFYAAEVIRGRPLSERAQEIGFRIGFALVIGLMLFAGKNDIWRLWNLASS